MRIHHRTTRPGALLALGLILSVSLVACGGAGEEQGEDLSVLAEPLNSAKVELEAKRAEVAQLDSQIEGAGEDVTEEALAEMEAQRAALVEEVNTLADDVNAKASELINQANLVEGEEPEGVVLEAILTIQQENMLIAREYINKGGDYSRAIQILEQTSTLPVDNPELAAALEEARANQYMDQERFAQVRNGMSPEEVRAILGTVNPRNRKEYPERNVEAWFYRKEEGIAGVYFQVEGEESSVYRTEFDVATE